MTPPWDGSVGGMRIAAVGPGCGTGLLAAGAELQIPPSAEENARTVGMTPPWGTEVLAGCALQPWALDAGTGLLAAGDRTADPSVR